MLQWLKNRSSNHPSWEWQSRAGKESWISTGRKSNGIAGGVCIEERDETLLPIALAASTSTSSLSALRPCSNHGKFSRCGRYVWKLKLK
ncbi:hypothetical protein I7I53_02644 [Histoplasma capsulatum var. duboisii H88]|uniref:Uncharacterized protein n=1 Tax=Ajellomyces capsulatus (strain H88) TaxID=544711 RepID=A0A8A1LSG0_AJEC8|nr:hypothetical protein I7I53_02644 [Histoplasma capsulatum var. duboisii H88]